MQTKIFLVGGAVRDKLLGIPPRDLDYAVQGETPESMLIKGYKALDSAFPVFTKDGKEYALTRTEVSTGKCYRDFSINTKGVTIEQDLLRRDLTINSMAIDIDTGTLIDPAGGEGDLKQKILRHTSSSFYNDPLRLIRTARFLARFSHLGFTIDTETLSLMEQMASTGIRNHLSRKRFFSELSKALSEPTPSAFINTLDNVGALKSLLPEIPISSGLLSRLDNAADQGGTPSEVLAVLLSFSNNPESLTTKDMTLQNHLK